jgi:hypothetical protein
MLYLFTIFHRLNSGGVRLTNQEIRNCIYSGQFNDEIKAFDRADPDWRILKKLIWGSMDRFRSVEVLLRVLAFGDQRDQYDGNLAKFLNIYMHQRMESVGGCSDLTAVMSTVANRARMILATIGQSTKLPLLVMEALLVALYSQRGNLASRTDADLVEAYKEMQAHSSFSDGARYAVSSVANVTQRLNAAVSAFGQK